MARLGGYTRGQRGSGVSLGGNSGVDSVIGGFDPDAAAYFAAIEAAGGTLSPTVKTEFNDLVLTGISEGWWGKLLRMYAILGGNINSAVIDAISLGSADNFNYVDGDFDGVNGLVGDAVTKALIDYENQDVIFASKESIQWGYASDNYENATKYKSGTFDGLTNTYYTVRQVSVNVRTYGGNLAVAANFSIPTAGSFYSVANVTLSSSSFYSILNGVASAQNTTLNNKILLSAPLGLSCLTSESGTPSTYQNETFRYYWAAEGCSLAECQQIISALNTFLTNIGAI